MRKYIALAPRRKGTPMLVDENARDELLQHLAEKAIALEPELFNFYLTVLECLIEDQAD